MPPVGFDYSPVFDRDFFTVELTEIIRQGEGSPIITLSRDLDLLRPIYSKTSAYGHFGRELPEFTWEQVDRADDLRRATGN